MHVHVLQHVTFEGLGHIEDWLNDHGHTFEYVRLYEGDPLPAIDAVEFIIAMGGPMSANDEKACPWLIEEKQFIKKVFDAGKAILGICLGAQLIAAARGEKVYPNAEKEIGWFPVQGISQDTTGFFEFPSSIEVLHWHGETFDLPACAVRIAQSEACLNQAFQLGPSTIGLQLHLEMKLESVDRLIENCRDELLTGGPWVQNEEQLCAGLDQYAEPAYALLDRILSYLADAT